MPGYTLLTAIAIVAVVAVELIWLRTGVFRTVQYWISMVIVFAFQIPVDGWLTKLRSPVVIYDDKQNLGVRWPWDIPIEDFGFGFAMVTLAILIWKRSTATSVRPSEIESGRAAGKESLQNETSPHVSTTKERG